jgi:glycosyltransferase involved in cell wall biosynthesis
MKIIFIENVRIPSERAHAYQIVQTCQWLGRLGHEVTLVNPSRAGNRDVFDAYGISDRPFLHVTLPVIDALAWSWFPWKKIAYAIQRWSFARAAARWAAKAKADAWYTRDPAMVDALEHAAKGRWVLELHDTPDANPARWARIKGRVSRFIVISTGLHARLVQLGIPRERITIAPDGYDPKEFEALKTREEARKALGVPMDAFVAIYAGSFYAWKGIDLLVKAWKDAPERAHLVLIGGPNEDRERLKRLVNPAVKHRIHFSPTMPRRYAVPLLTAGDAGLLTTSPEFEIGHSYTSPLKLFEYLAAGLPVIASDVPSSHEILTDDVAIFYPYTESGVVAAIKKAMDDHAWREHASRLAPSCAAPYTWERRVHLIAEAILG